MRNRDRDPELERPTYRDDARAVKTLNKFLGGAAVRPPKLGNKRLVTAKLSEVAITGLKQIALELGYTHGAEGNLSMLLEALGTHTLQVSVPTLTARHLD